MGIYIFLCVLAFVFLIPLLLTIHYSLMLPSEYTVMIGNNAYTTFTFIPEHATLVQYAKALLSSLDALRMFWNAFGMTFAIVVGQVCVCTMAAYAFAHLRFWGRDFLFMILVGLMLLPPQATLVSNFVVLNKIGLVGHYASVILPGIFSAFGVCILRAFMRTIPTTCVEAANMDGAGFARVFISIILPQARPGIASLALLCFIDNWNMVEQPLILLRDTAKYPLSIYISRMTDTGIAFAFAIIYMIPPLLLYLYVQDDFVKGIRL